MVQPEVVKDDLMRTSVKLAALTVMVMAVFCSQTTFAQGPGYGQAMPPGNYSPVGWGQLPAEGYNPWPNISPFENKFSQHVNQNGLWFSDNMPVVGGSARKYFFSTEALSTTTKEDHGLIGNSNAQSYYELIYPQLVVATDQQYADDFEGYNYYDAIDGAIMGHLEGSGMRMKGGWFNPDDSGFVFEGTWNGHADSVFDARRFSTTRSSFPATSAGAFGSLGSVTGFASGVDELELMRRVLSPPDFLLSDIAPVDLDELLQRNLLNLRGLPVDDGTFGGTTIPYDLGFRTEYTSRVLGGGLSYLMAPIVKSKGFMLRPVIGARYMNIQEGFRFDGEDSGGLYDDTVAGTADPIVDLKLQSIPDGVDNDGDGIIDNGGIGENSTTFTAGNFSFVALGDQFGASLVRAFTTSDAVSHLAGPEFGVRYDFGGDDLKIWGQTKVGLLVNHERIELQGDNIGMATRIQPGSFGTGILGAGIPTDLIAPTAANPNPNRFSDEKDSTHISPLFEQSFFAEIPVFQYLPVLRNSRSFEGARLKLGYTFTFVDHVASNTQSIIWRGNPQAGLFPELDIDRRSWWTSNWSAGVEWRY